MCYDFLTFLLALAVFIICVYYEGWTSKNPPALWQINTTYYFCKIAYGILSAPWFLFALPVLGQILTKSRATAYDKNGNCVPVLKTKTVPPKDDETDELLGRKGGGIEELF